MSGPIPLRYYLYMLNLDQWLALGGLVTALLGIIAAYVFYLKGKREPSPWCSVHPLRIHIVDTAQTKIEGLEVRHNGVIISDRNITATTIFFGNRGNAPIRSVDVLVPLTIRFPDDTEILDVRVIQASRPICGFMVGPIDSGGHTASLGFDIIERFDGAKIQIIYRGDPDAAITVSGTFVGCMLSVREYESIGFAALSPISRALIRLSPMLIAVLITLLMSTFGHRTLDYPEPPPTSIVETLPSFMQSLHLPIWVDWLIVVIVPLGVIVLLLALTSKLIGPITRLKNRRRKIELLQIPRPPRP